MNLIDFLRMFYSLGTDITRLVLWQNGKCLGEHGIGDTRYIRSEHRSATVKMFSVPKRTHALIVVLADPEKENKGTTE